MPPANLLNTVANSILNLSILINGLYIYIIVTESNSMKQLALSIVVIGFVGLGLNIFLNAIQYAYCGVGYTKANEKIEVTSLEDVFRYHRQKYGEADDYIAMFGHLIMLIVIISIVIIFSIMYLSLGVLNSVLLLLVQRNLNITLA